MGSLTRFLSGVSKEEQVIGSDEDTRTTGSQAKRALVYSRALGGQGSTQEA